ncbi:MAG: nitroreductase family protein [Oscillospiraceae bacterium]|nr:nitroreductase family protein [Oscillospiraceae bacterium]
MLKDLLKASRSYRGYDMSRKVTREELMELVDHVRYAPSTVNGQPLRYYLVHEEAEVAAIQSLTLWAKALKDITLPHEGKYPTAFIIICQDTERGPNLNRYIRDVGIAAQTILLAAAERELGGCMIGSFNPDKVKETLNLADHLRPMLVLAIGKPDETIVLTEVGEDGSTKYWRDENDVHYVPKRSLEDILI